MPKTMFDKLWEAHEVSDGLIYIDLHLVHEVTSPQAFDGLRLAGRGVRRPDKTLATADHNTPTDGTMAARLIADELSRVQVETLERNCEEFGIPIYSLGSDRQGIVHVIGPELGVTQPGMTIVCGDSHTSTHGAFGALAFGIGTSEVEHVLATQCLVQKRPKTMRISYSGELGDGVTPKDLILATIGRLGTGGMVGHAVEYAGPAIEALSMPGRMTICNMTIEGGGRAGMIAPDETTFEWVRGREAAPARLRRRRRALAAAADRRRRDLRPARSRSTPASLSPMVTWGTNPGHGRRGHRLGARPRLDGVARRPRVGRARARLHGAGAGHADDRDRRSTASSSAPAPTRGSRTCARPPRSVEGRKVADIGARHGRPRLPAGQERPPRRRASTRSSARPASNGARPAARCAWA